MRKLRMGNDIFIRWTLQGEEITTLPKEELRLEIRAVGRHPEPLTGFEWKNGAITLVYPAAAQQHAGTYTLTLYQETDGMRRTIDSCQAFALVRTSCQQDGENYIVELNSRFSSQGNAPATGLSILEEFLRAQTAFFTNNSNSLEAELVARLLGMADYDGTPGAYASLYTRLSQVQEQLRTLTTRNGGTVEDTDNIATLIGKLRTLPPNVYTLNKANSINDNVNYKSVKELPVIRIEGGNMNNVFQNLQLVEEIHLQGVEDVATAREAFKGSGLLRKAYGLERMERLIDGYHLLANCSNYEGEVTIPSPSLSIAESIIHACTLVTRLTIDQTSLMSAYNLCYGSSVKEVVLLGTPNAVDVNWRQAFSGASLLEVIKGVIDVSGVITATNLMGIFSQCYRLTEVRIKGLGVNLALNNSPLLSRESALYVMENAKTVTRNVTLTFSSALKEDGRITDDDIAIATAKGWKVAFA